MSSRIIACVVFTLFAACSRPWHAVIRFEGGTSNPQVPMMIKIDDAATEQFSGVMEGRCISLQLNHRPSAEHPIHVEVRDTKGTIIGAVNIGDLDSSGMYIPVDGQLGVLTIRPQLKCP